MPKLPRRFFEQSTLDLAKNLLGCVFVHVLNAEKMAGIIVETEAYLHLDDPACHAARGETNRNRIMFGPPGRLYVYTIHTQFCMNIVSESSGCGAAVLIRAIEPCQGIELMGTRRVVRQSRELTNGPGKLCQSFGIDLTLNGEDLCHSDRVWLEPRSTQYDFETIAGPRIGISQAKERPYRFFVNGSPFVSGRAMDHSTTRNVILATCSMAVPTTKVSTKKVSP